jgi:hypothetical protein
MTLSANIALKYIQIFKNVRVGKIFLNWGSIPISEITGLGSTVFLLYRFTLLSATANF